MSSTARYALIASTVAVLLSATHQRAEAWSCDSYYDTKAFPEWEPVGAGCSMFILEEYARYDVAAVELEAYVDGDWVAIDADVSTELVQLTTYFTYCNDSDTCDSDSWQEQSEYALYTITPAEPVPSDTDLRVMIVDSTDLPFEIAQFATGDGSAACMSAASIPEPYCSGPPCEYEYPDECGGDDGDDDDDDDDDGPFDVSGCSAAGDTGAPISLLLVLVPLLWRRRQASLA